MTGSQYTTGFTTGYNGRADGSILGLFNEQVHRQPYAIGIVDGEVIVTYAELDAASNLVANCLDATAVRAHSVIALSLNPGAIVPSVVLGILRSGHAYLFVPPEQPTDRSLFMIRDSDARYIITSEEIGANFSGFEDAAVVIAHTVMNSPFKLNLITHTDVQSTANLVYDFSEGRPRKICYDHRSLLRCLLNYNAAPDMEPVCSTYTQLKQLLSGGKIIY